ncbi:MAG: hypothetical protein AB7I04_18500 [Pseudomonadales bacterium]
MDITKLAETAEQRQILVHRDDYEDVLKGLASLGWDVERFTTVLAALRRGSPITGVRSLRLVMRGDDVELDVWRAA